MGIKSDKNRKDPLPVKQNNYLTKIINFNFDVVYDFDAWPRNPTINFKFKNCLFHVTSLSKNNDKERYVKSQWNNIW